VLFAIFAFSEEKNIKILNPTMICINLFMDINDDITPKSNKVFISIIWTGNWHTKIKKINKIMINNEK